MHKSRAEVTYLVTDSLQLRQNLVDTKRAERVAALNGADESADVRVQNMSLEFGDGKCWDRNYPRILTASRVA